MLENENKNNKLYEKELEKIRRKNNLLEIMNKKLFKENVNKEQEIEYLKKRNNLLEIIETYLPHRISKLQETSNKNFLNAINELQMLEKALIYENNNVKGIKNDEDTIE